MKHEFAAATLGSRRRPRAAPPVDPGPRSSPARPLNFLFKPSLYLCFFVSGSCGLAYEVLWAKYLGLFIGNSTYAHAVVLSGFMGGLALGNYRFGSIADRSRNCFKIYAKIELAIGLYAFLTPWILMLD